MGTLHDTLAHGVTLRGRHVALRPLNDDDWASVHRWWNDPVVSFYADANAADANAGHDYSLIEVQKIYRSISEKAFIFMIEFGEATVGDCWLQQMNLERILHEHPDKDIRRIDIAIGDPLLWGRGIGSEAIRLLVEFGFRRQGSDAIFACEVADWNPRSNRAFEKAGFVRYQFVPQPPPDPSGNSYDLILTRDQFDHLCAA